MKKFSLLSRAAVAAIAAGTPSEDDDQDAGPAPEGQDAEEEEEGEGNEPKPDTGAAKEEPKPDTAKASDAPVQVVAANDAAALIAEADAKGFARANARMSKVFASAEGKANPTDAAFLLANSNASAEDVIGHLKAKGPATSSIAPTNVNLGTDPNERTNSGASATGDIEKSWDEALERDQQARSPLMVPAANAAPAGATVNTRALPRTGN